LVRSGDKKPCYNKKQKTQKYETNIKSKVYKLDFLQNTNLKDSKDRGEKKSM